MLETALQNHSSSPSETSLALLSFFRHEYPLGGAVEARFLRFFPILCDRIFGPILILSGDNKSNAITVGSGGNNTDMNIKSEDLTLVQSAWLNQKSQWRSPSATSSSNRNGNSDNGVRRVASSTSNSPYSSSYNVQARVPSRIETDPVVQLLSPSPSSTASNQIYTTCFIHIIESAETSRQMKNIRLPFPFLELPRNLQESLVRQLQSQPQQQKLHGSETPSDRLWLRMHYPPNDQKELAQNLRQHMPSMMYSMSSGKNAQNMKSPRSSPTFHLTKNDLSMTSNAVSQQQHFTFDSTRSSSGGAGFRNQKQLSSTSTISTYSSLWNDAKVMLDAWEYFMILFLRHGVYATKYKNIIQQYGKSVGSGSSRTQSFGEKMYYYLFTTYCEYYIPHVFEARLLQDNKKIDLRQQQQLGQSSYDRELEMITTHEQKSDLWIRFVVEFFLEFNHVYPSTNEALDNLLTRAAIYEKDIGLEHSFELSSLLPIPSKLNRRTSYLGHREGGVGGTLRLTQSYSPPSKQVQKCLRTLIDQLIRDPAIAYSCHRSSRENTGKSQYDHGYQKSFFDWPLQNIQTIVQPSFYNYVRTALRYGPVHVRHSSFYAALELWLTWLEPWNVVKREL